LHSPVETASIADIQATADLLTRFLTTLDMELLSKLTEVHSYD
jgi:putative aminopeptidase FrvX